MGDLVIRRMKAWRDIAMLPQVTEQMDIVRKVMRGLRELRIAREVSRRSA